MHHPLQPLGGAPPRCLSACGLAILAAALLAGCGTAKPRKPGPGTKAVAAKAAADAPELDRNKVYRLLRSTERNVNQFEELGLQGKTREMVALRRLIGESVDRNFATFEKVALKGEFVIQRNMAVKGLGFPIEKRAQAREVLIKLCEDPDLTIVQNAALALGILRDRKTDLTPLVKLLAHGDLTVRTNAATALRDLFLIIPTPRNLTPQYFTAIDRLVTLMHEKASPRGRRAAVWALANLRHPEVLPHLVSALNDSDELVQIGGLYGIEVLGDQRALEPVLDYLHAGPTTNGGSWARKALVRIALQGGFAKSASELDKLGTTWRAWRDWFRAARMK